MKILKNAVLNGVHALDIDIHVDQSALDKIIRYSNHEVRTALNLLESAS